MVNLGLFVNIETEKQTDRQKLHTAEFLIQDIEIQYIIAVNKHKQHNVWVSQSDSIYKTT